MATNISITSCFFVLSYCTSLKLETSLPSRLAGPSTDLVIPTPQCKIYSPHEAYTLNRRTPKLPYFSAAHGHSYTVTKCARFAVAARIDRCIEQENRISHHTRRRSRLNRPLLQFIRYYGCTICDP